MMYKLNEFRKRIYKREIAARISTASVSASDFMFGAIDYNNDEDFENRYYGLRKAVSSVVFDKRPMPSVIMLLNSCKSQEWYRGMVLVEDNGCYLLGVNLIE